MTMLYLDLLETKANEALARKREYEQYVEIDASDLLLMIAEIRRLRYRRGEAGSVGDAPGDAS